MTLGFINAVGGFLRERADWVVILVGTALILLFIELRLRSIVGALFAQHEKRESELHASSTLVAEAAAGTAREAARHIEELRVETNALRLDINNLTVLVKAHDAKIASMETRLLRASLAVPRRGDP